jgi:hypothetical protein
MVHPNPANGGQSHLSRGASTLLTQRPATFSSVLRPIRARATSCDRWEWRRYTELLQRFLPMNTAGSGANRSKQDSADNSLNSRDMISAMSFDISNLHPRIRWLERSLQARVPLPDSGEPAAFSAVCPHDRTPCVALPAPIPTPKALKRMKKLLLWTKATVRKSNTLKIIAHLVRPQIYHKSYYAETVEPAARDSAASMAASIVEYFKPRTVTASNPKPIWPMFSSASSISGRTIAATNCCRGLGLPRASNSSTLPESFSRFTPLQRNQASTQRVPTHRSHSARVSYWENGGIWSREPE